MKRRMLIYIQSFAYPFSIAFQSFLCVLFH